MKVLISQDLSFSDFLPILLVLVLSCRTTPAQYSDRGSIESVIVTPTQDPFPESSFLTTENLRGTFPLVKDGTPAGILVSPFDHPGVVRLASLFQKDLSHVSGKSAELLTGSELQSGPLIIVGTLGKSEVIDRLVEEKKIDVSELAGKWEQFMIMPVNLSADGVDDGLIIVGSDKRGTLFGMFHLSEEMGVSPWYWWADVPIKKRRNIFVKHGKYTLGEPKVKYRGIFINDEAPALTGWAREKFGGFNHLFYEKVFELILRKKANYLWPAMWRPSVFATDDPENLRLADEYGIVISTTHHEPMMRYHEEWSRYNGGAWNYETNKTKLQEFWRGGIERMGDLESVVTVGMRGDGDEAMSEETAVDVMKTIIADQRKIISEVTGKPPEETPQVWAVYKEVQDYYDKGMRVDDDILVLFCDDNWGNIRILPKREERERKGGYGMYYHFDFVGGPVSYRWINVTQIERVWEQMNLAYQWGVRDLWIVNVGDIKPMELPISFFLDYAWDPEIKAAELPRYYERWAQQQFGSEHAKDIAEVVALCTKYSARRTPEMITPETYSLRNYREAETILAEYKKLSDRSNAIYEKLHDDYKASYYQLVAFPVEVSRNINEMYVAAGRNRLYSLQSRASANLYADTVKEKFYKDAELARYFHETLSGGKWNHMMAQTHIGYTSWDNPPVNRMPQVSYIQVPDAARLGYVVENGVGHAPWSKDGLYAQRFPTFDPVNDQHYYVEIFNRGNQPLAYTLKPSDEWIKLSSNNGVTRHETRVFVSIDWEKVPTGRDAGALVVSGAGQDFSVEVPIRRDLATAFGFIENNGVISIEAANISRKFEVGGITWTIIPNMGRTGSAITPEPADAERLAVGKESPRIEYDFTVFNAQELKVEAYLSPTLNYRKNEGLKYAIAIDDEAPQVVNIHEGDTIPDWEYPDWWNDSVTDHIRKKQTLHRGIKPGTHTLKIWMIDPGVAFQKFVIDVGGLKPSYLGPPEAIRKEKQKYE